MTTPALTLKASQLHRLLKPALRFTGTDMMLPVLTTVRLQGVGDHVYATATDRFRLGMIRTALAALEDGKREQDATGLDVLLTGDDARTMLGLFAPSRSHDPDLEVTWQAAGDTPHAGQELTVRGGSQHRATGPRVTYEAAVMAGVAPNVAALIRDTLRGEAHTDVARVNPRFYADLMAAAAEVVDVRHDPVHVRHVGQKVVATAGEDFVALLMQRRHIADGPELGTLEHPEVRDTWLSDLDTMSAAAAGRAVA